MTLRLWHRFRIAPGLRVNLIKGGSLASSGEANEYLPKWLWLCKTTAKPSNPIGMRVASLVKELTRKPLAIHDEYHPRSRIKPKRAVRIASEILSLYSEVSGGL
jgi:hypothetical protein